MAVSRQHFSRPSICGWLERRTIRQRSGPAYGPMPMPILPSDRPQRGGKRHGLARQKKTSPHAMGQRGRKSRVRPARGDAHAFPPAPRSAVLYDRAAAFTVIMVAAERERIANGNAGRAESFFEESFGGCCGVICSARLVPVRKPMLASGRPSGGVSCAGRQRQTSTRGRYRHAEQYRQRAWSTCKWGAVAGRRAPTMWVRHAARGVGKDSPTKWTAKLNPFAERRGVRWTAIAAMLRPTRSRIRSRASAAQANGSFGTIGR